MFPTAGSDSLTHVKEISATEASRNFSKLLDEVEQGKDFSITRGGKTVARLGPARGKTGADLVALFERLGPDPELADLIEEGRRAVIDQGPRFVDGA
jgi:prevent-host-death family protein